MTIGALAMMNARTATKSYTKDVDVVPLVLVDGKHKIPPWEETLNLAKALSDTVRPRKDQTCIELLLSLEGPRVRVELVRGRSNDAGGYFVTRRVLEACARESFDDNRAFDIRGEGLAILKAWAAVDQEKLVAAGKDRIGFHKARAEGFRQDVIALAARMLDAPEHLDNSVLRRLLEACPGPRRARIEQILREAGFGLRN